jgi:hypothetical protein
MRELNCEKLGENSAGDEKKRLQTSLLGARRARSYQGMCGKSAEKYPDRNARPECPERSQIFGP